MLLALGIDPGSKITGYGLVAKDGPRLELVGAGQIKTGAKMVLAERLNLIFEELQQVINKYSPDAVAVEEVFYAKNIRSAILLGHVRGVAFLAAAAAGIPVFEYPATVIKKSVVGYGQAGKDQVQLMVKRILKTDMEFGLDTSDALAAAVCHLNQNQALGG